MAEATLEAAPDWAADDMSDWALQNYQQKYAMKDEDGEVAEVWPDTAYRVVRHVLGALGYTDHDPEFQRVLELVVQRKFMPGGRYLYAAGRPMHQVNNCTLYRCEDSREGWADCVQKAMMALMTGAGVGVVYSDVRHAGSPIKKTGGEATGPISVMEIINEAGRHIMQGGNRRSAIWAGLHWDHPDCEEFMRLKDWPEEVRQAKEEDFMYAARMDQTNISVILNNEFFFAYENRQHPKHELAHRIYDTACRLMVSIGEPGFSIDIGPNEGENLRNACTEITSYDDSDICNLGSLNLSRFESIDEFREAIPYATLFLLAGSVYSDVPHPEVRETRERNRRLGLGLMGIHEWLLKRGRSYEPDEELGTWLEEYARSTEYAAQWADKHGLSHPIKTRAIAPNGTIAIVGETTGGCEPIFCVAYKRRVRHAQVKGKDVVKATYVIDPTAERLIQNHGVDPYEIEDAYSLSLVYERRIAFQAWLQQYVDHGISSTINLHAPITDPEEAGEFAETLYRYLPKLRGITCYPDGVIGGQPLTAADYWEAHSKRGVTFEDSEETCKGGVCGA